MASDKNEDSKFPVAGLLILVTVIGGALFYQQPYKSDRPIIEKQGKAVIVGDKRAQSRLWQDPFISVKAHINAEKKSNQSKLEGIILQALRLTQPKTPSGKPDKSFLQLEGSRNAPEGTYHHDLSLQLGEIKSLIGEDPPKFKVLIVVTEGTPFASGTEYRLRHRYAVVSALGVASISRRKGSFLGIFPGTAKICETKISAGMRVAPPLPCLSNGFNPAMGKRITYLSYGSKIKTWIKSPWRL